MRYRMLGGALAALAFLTLAPAALAQSWTSYGLLDASRSTQHFPCLSATLNGVAVCYPGHVLMGTSAGSPTAVNMTIPGALDVNVVGGGGSLSATAHATAPSDLSEGATNAGLVVDLSHHLFTRAMQDGVWTVSLGGTEQGYLSSLVTNSAAVQAQAGSDAAKAVAVQGIAGGKPVPVTCSGCGGSSQPFAPDSATPTVIAPTTTAVRSAQLGAGTTVQVINSGAVAASIAIGGSTVAAVITNTSIPPGMACNFYYAGGGAYVSGITGSGTGQLTLNSGTGGPPGCYIYADMSSSAGVKGTIAAASAAADPPVVEGCRAATTSPTAVTDGQVVYAQCGPGGKRVVEFSPSGLTVKGSASTTGTTATTLIAAQGAGVKLYVTGLQCSNTSATTVMVTLNDSAASSFIVPAGSGNNPPAFLVPLDIAANTALTFTLSAGASTVYCNAQGFKGA